MKLKELDGFELNEVVFIPEENKWGRITRIDGHVYPICLDTTVGSRYSPSQLEKDHDPNKPSKS